ncbi:MAG: hypothetical protein R2867_26755 [Caldilineaceae bacterium]
MVKRYTTPLALFVTSLLLLAGCIMIAPQPQVAPEAATWGTWVLAAHDELRPAAPPDEAATQAEIAELHTLAGQRDAGAAGAGRLLEYQFADLSLGANYDRPLCIFAAGSTEWACHVARYGGHV